MYTLTCSRNVDTELANGRPPAELLTPAEAAVFAGLKTEKRRRDWLTGRFAAKQLVQYVYQEKTGRAISFSDFAILKKKNGAPVVSWKMADSNRPVSLSISHAGEVAFCALSVQQNAQLGCDVELVSPRSSTFVGDYFTSAEQALVNYAAYDDKTTLINAIWSGKEAILKALELGLTVDTRAVSCLPEFSQGRGTQLFTISLNPDRIEPPLTELTGRWWVKGEYVFTLVAPNTLFAKEPVQHLLMTADSFQAATSVYRPLKIQRTLNQKFDINSFC